MPFELVGLISLNMHPISHNREIGTLHTISYLFEFSIRSLKRLHPVSVAKMIQLESVRFSQTEQYEKSNGSPESLPWLPVAAECLRNVVVPYEPVFLIRNVFIFENPNKVLYDRVEMVVCPEIDNSWLPAYERKASNKCNCRQIIQNNRQCVQSKHKLVIADHRRAP